MNGYEVKSIKFGADIIDWVSARHYSQTCPSSTSNAFGLFDTDQKMIGVCLFGCPTRNQARQKYVGCVELTRLFIEDVTPKNAESFFIGHCLRWLKRNTKLNGIVSYSDPTVGHLGIVYQATNFKLIGFTGISYHFKDFNGKRVHKRGVWGEARRLGIKEDLHAQNLGLTKSYEQPKKIYFYEFFKGFSENLSSPNLKKRTKPPISAVNCFQVQTKNLPVDYDPAKHASIDIAGRVFFIDRSELEFVLKHQWFASGNYMTMKGGAEYSGSARTFHKMMVPCADGRMIDHINGNKRDNRRLNLRDAHPVQKNHNNKTGMRGVKYREKLDKYDVTIMFNYQTRWIGRFSSKAEAGLAYDLAAVRLFGSSACTTAPLSDYQIPEICEADKLPLNSFVKNYSKRLCATVNCRRKAKGSKNVCSLCEAKNQRRITAKEEGRKVTDYAPRVADKTSICTISECVEKVFARNMCSKHWREKRKADGRTRKSHMADNKPRCKEADCNKLGGHRIDEKHWLCRKHYNAHMGIITNIPGRPKAELVQCNEEGCTSMGSVNVGLCKKHYRAKWYQSKKKPKFESRSFII